MNLIQKATLRQNNAANVNQSVWVSASAGTGKTYVLTKRIVQLLLSDHSLNPSEILAVTFTRAAAREMENRIRMRVEAWAIMEDTDLEEDLKKLLERTPTVRDKQRAKSLFHLVLNEGVHTNTIHGFCQYILGRFPVEAGLTPGFRVLDEIEANELLAKARSTVLVKAFNGQVKPEWVFEYFAENVGEGKLSQYLNTFVMNTHRFQRLIEKYGNVEGVLDALADALKVEKNISPKSFTGDYSTEGVMPMFEAILPHLNTLKGKRAQTIAASVADAMADPLNENKIRKAVMSFFKKDGEPITASYALGKKVWEEGGVLVDLFGEIQSLMARHIETMKAKHTYLLSACLIYLGGEVVRTYGELKSRDGVLDFDDLIALTAKLVENKQYKDWIRYKMDRQIRHVLLDEAQDTDRMQWHIVRAFVEEFYAGEGQHENPRTFFAVGDMKQSIYRFRGAEPFVFDDMRKYMQNQENKNPVAVENLVASFRSSETILGFVDDVFTAPHRRKAVDAFVEDLKHDAIHEKAGGHIEVWPLVETEKAKSEPREPWTLPNEIKTTVNTKQQVANQVASSIAELLNSNEILHTTKQHPNAGDVMILLRSRTLMPFLIVALDEHNIPHTGADLINLNDDPIVDDMLQLMNLAINPANKFAAVQVLKSPLFGWGDEQVLTMSTLPSDLLEFINKGATLSPYKFVMEAQACFKLRQKYYVSGDVRRVDESIDAFLEAALAWQGHGSLLEFVHMFSTLDQRTKRELAGASDRVRLLTAHGSKGLEAPVVYMPDSGADFYDKLSKESYLWRMNENFEDELFLARLPKADACAFQKEIEDEERARIFNDEMRLLYVALTRAKDRLYIGGEGKEDADSWHRNILESIQHKWQQRENGAYVLSNPVTVEGAEEESETLEGVEEDLPAFYMQNPPAVQAMQQLRAAKHIEEEPLTLKDNRTQKKLFARGRAVHKLLEVLPTLEKGDKEIQGRIYVSQVLHEFNELEQEKAFESALRVLDNFPDVFAKNSRAEVPVYTERSGKRFDGIIDRLVIKDDEVWVIDYKTDGHVPENIPPHYTEQLQAYVWALEPIFKEKRIKAGIIWTSLLDPRLDWVIDSEAS